jgi:hypothetical protein
MSLSALREKKLASMSISQSVSVYWRDRSRNHSSAAHLSPGEPIKWYAQIYARRFSRPINQQEPLANQDEPTWRRCISPESVSPAKSTRGAFQVRVQECRPCVA